MIDVDNAPRRLLEHTPGTNAAEQLQRWGIEPGQWLWSRREWGEGDWSATAAKVIWCGECLVVLQMWSRSSEKPEWALAHREIGVLSFAENAWFRVFWDAS